MMERLAISEFSRRTGKSERTIRKWVDTGRLRTDYELINNRKTRVIVVDDNTISDFINIEVDTGGPEQNTPLQNTGVPDDIPDGSVMINYENMLEFVKQVYVDNKELNEQNRLLAEYAGQAKLLTDSEHRTKEEYFKTIQENAMLKATLDLKNQQLEELKQKLETKESKVKSWWSKL